jgi:hypothetical protein
MSVIFATCLISFSSFAQSTVAPQGTPWNSGNYNKWTAGDVVSSSELNQNFDQLYTQVQTLSATNSALVTSLSGGVSMQAGKTAIDCPGGSGWCNVAVAFPVAFTTAPSCTVTPFSTQTNGGSFGSAMGNTTGTVMAPTTTGFKWASVIDATTFTGFLHWICVGN